MIRGMAMIQAGFVRATKDIDLLVDADRDNLTRLRTALLDVAREWAERMNRVEATGLVREFRHREIGLA